MFGHPRCTRRGNELGDFGSRGPGVVGWNGGLVLDGGGDSALVREAHDTVGVRKAWVVGVLELLRIVRTELQGRRKNMVGWELAGRE